MFDRSPLHAAAENGHVTCVEQLCVSEPGHVNDRDERGLTPLHLAARENHRYVSIIRWKYSLHLRLVFFLALLSRRTLSLASLGRDTYLIALVSTTFLFNASSKFPLSTVYCRKVHL